PNWPPAGPPCWPGTATRASASRRWRPSFTRSSRRPRPSCSAWSGRATACSAAPATSASRAARAWRSTEGERGAGAPRWGQEQGAHAPPLAGSRRLHEPEDALAVGRRRQPVDLALLVLAERVQRHPPILDGPVRHDSPFRLVELQRPDPPRHVVAVEVVPL